METLLDVRGLGATSLRFKRQMIALAHRIETEPDDLAATISFESGFDPAAKNPGSSATGLIGFMGGPKGSAVGVGTTVQKLARMTALQQLPYVERYFELAGAVGRMRTAADTYLAVFAPAFMGRSDPTVIFAADSPNPKERERYEANKALDTEQDGTITVANAVRPVRNIIAAAERRPRIEVSDAPPASSVSGWAGVLAFGALVLGLMRWKRNAARL